jgi:SAM-dependent methyltransferase
MGEMPGPGTTSATGRRTLEVFADTPRLSEWLYAKLAPAVHGDVLEIGSGIGNISRLIRPRATRLVVTDMEPRYLASLRAAFGGDTGVEVAAYDLDAPPPPAVAGRRYDAIVAVNVIEHIADDRTLLQRLAALLRPGGALLVYVPACPAAYGSLDVALGHHRRYTPATLAALLRDAGLDPGRPRYVNLIGLVGWLVSARILRRPLLSARGVALFERLMPLVRLEDHVPLPVGLGLWTRATRLS